MATPENDKFITAAMLPPELSNNITNEMPSDATAGTIDLPLREAREVFEKQYLSAQLVRFDHNITKMAIAIGMERSALHRKLKILEITTQDD
jgi:two-component system nitrogen regulation response regulator NtrX